MVFIKDVCGSIVTGVERQRGFDLYQKHNPLIAASSGIKILYGISSAALPE